MSEGDIKPHDVTRPIQLLAACLVALIALDGSLLAAAGAIARPTWAPAVLVVAAVVNIPLFVGLLFLLLTRYRREMQADRYYARHLDSEAELSELLIDRLRTSRIDPQLRDALLKELEGAEYKASDQRELRSHDA